MTPKPPPDDEDGYIGPWEDPPSAPPAARRPSAMDKTLTVGTAIRVAVAVVVVAGIAVIGWQKYSEHEHEAEQAKQQADVTAYVKTSLQDEVWDKYASEYGVMQVRDVVLIRESDHKFTGTATVWTAKTGEHSIHVDVTTDGSNVMWQTERGAFLFLAGQGYGS